MMASSASSVSAHTSRISMRLPLQTKKRSTGGAAAAADASADGADAGDSAVSDIPQSK